MRLPKEKRAVQPPAEVSGLNFIKLRNSIIAHGVVFIDHLQEIDECYLAIQEWPKASGHEYYACVMSGLLFDKKDGHCRQSSGVRLILSSVEPASFTMREVEAWSKKRQESSVRYGYVGSKFSGDGDDDGE